MADVLFMAVTLALTFVPQILAITWSISAWRNYYSVVDVIWPICVAVLAASYAVLVPGFFFRKVILVVLVGLWAGRLSMLLLLRLKNSFPAEEPRYQRLKAQWGENAARNFFIFFQLQGVASVFLAMPFWIYIMHPDMRMDWTEYVGIALFLMGLVGETVADEQLRQFRAQPKNKGQTLQTGLWKYSRHPNYFFEWLVWVGLAVMASSAPRSELAFLAPAVMLLLLLRWTGVPLSEGQAQTHRQDYSRYRTRTSAFFPWFPQNRRGT